MSHEHDNEYDHEPIRGLPDLLPDGERIICQIEPDWWSMARHSFHLVQIGVYFAALIGAHQAYHYASGGSLSGGLYSLAWQGGLSLATLGIIAFLGRMYARTTVYTLTNRRIVMRFGVALPMMINLPLTRIISADLRPLSGGSGDIALSLEAGERISYMAIWPNARAWRFSPVVPCLRSVPDAANVAATLVTAVQASASPDVNVAQRTTKQQVAEDQQDGNLDRAGVMA